MRGIFLLVLTTGWFFAASPSFAVVERRIEKRFEVPAKALLNVDTFAGNVHVTEDASARVIEVVVIQTSEVGTETAMDDRLASLALTVTQEKNGAVALKARYKKPVSLTWTSWPPVNLVYEIKVPRRCDVDVRTREGRIVIGSLEGRVTAENDTGTIFVGEIDGAVTVRSNAGQVGITAATGDIEASTVTGNITVGRAGARTRLSSSGGYMEVQRAAGKVVVRGSGSDAQVGFAPQAKAAADIALSGGALTLILEKPSEYTLDLRASVFGKVALRGELALDVISGGDGRSRLKANVNGGGPRIVARAKGGSILIRAVEPLPVLVAKNKDERMLP